MAVFANVSRRYLHALGRSKAIFSAAAFTCGYSVSTDSIDDLGAVPIYWRC